MGSLAPFKTFWTNANSCSRARLLRTFQKIKFVSVNNERSLCQGCKRLQNSQLGRKWKIFHESYGYQQCTHFRYREMKLFARRQCTDSPKVGEKALSEDLKSQTDAVKTSEAIVNQSATADEQEIALKVSKATAEATKPAGSKRGDQKRQTIETSIPKESLNPYVYKPISIDIDYNVRYTRNTFISGSRAIGDYLLTYDDLEYLRKTKVRTAYNDSDLPPDYLYLKLDVEQRALEVWGSLEALEREKKRRRKEMEAGERYRKGLSVLLGHLKKSMKDQTRREQEDKIFGGRNERILLLQGSARVVLYAVATNLVVALFKFSAYLYTGSASMMSEAIHSLADSANQCLLALGILKSIKEPSPDHPYGWSRARYVYSLISGVGIFFLGCGFSVYHGITELINPTTLESLAVMMYNLAMEAEFKTN